MNNLSWLLYAAEVSGNLQEMFQAFVVLSVIGVAFWVFTSLMWKTDTPNENFAPFWRKIGYFFVSAALVSAVLSAVVPSKDTVYAIAASEMGEQAIQTPLAKKAFNALSAWLDRQTNPPK